MKKDRCTKAKCRRLTCSCGTEAIFEANEVQSCQREGSWVVCPVCNSFVSINSHSVARETVPR